MPIKPFPNFWSAMLGNDSVVTRRISKIELIRNSDFYRFHSHVFKFIFIHFKQNKIITVSQIGHGNFTPFVVANDEVPIRTMLIGPVVQVLVKLEEIFFQAILKLMHLLAHALAFAKLKPSLPHTS
ncbi:MAG: hypothetical protein WC924_00305 [Candidatus Gracilibacteria bacterium]